MGDRRHLIQSQAGIEVLLDVLEDRAEFGARKCAVFPAILAARRQGVPNELDGHDVGQGLCSQTAPTNGTGRQFRTNR